MAFGQGIGLISLFSRHRVAANLLMVSMIFAGIWALTRLNTQFLPNFDLNVITVNAIWAGASAEDVERSLTVPLEQELRSLDYLKKMESNSQLGRSHISLEFERGMNMANALQQTKERIDLLDDLPSEVDQPEVVLQQNFEPIASIVLSGPENLQELRPLAYQFERELLDKGIAKVDIVGLPEQMIAIQVPTLRLAELNISLGTISKKIAQISQDVPAGTISRQSLSQQLRGSKQGRSVEDFENLPIFSDNLGQLLLLGDIAEIELRSQDDEVTLHYRGKPAVQLDLLRTRSADALDSADILQQWVAKVTPTLPQGVSLTVYYQSWKLIKERINLLLKNGAGGLILILILLFVFLNSRVAFWVAMGIPVSFFAALAVLYFFSGTINMVSLFSMIMALGIIVDDTIVVGEESLSLLNKGKPVLEAVELGAKKMLAPIMASSITTICAFLPLLLIGDVIGAILSDIPKVVICIIIASVIESFLVLPGHLYQSFRNLKVMHNPPVRHYFDTRFKTFRETKFRPFVTKAIEYRVVTVCIAGAALLLVVGLIVGGRVNFTFFPSPDGTQVQAHIEFSAGTSTKSKSEFLSQVEKALWITDAELTEGDDHLVATAVTLENRGGFEKGRSVNYSAVNVELIGPDNRKTTNKQFIEKWRSHIRMNPDIANLIIASPRAGPPGQDIDIQLTGTNPKTLKQASLELQHHLQGYKGVTDVQDDFPFGQQQAIFSLTPEGRTVGLTIEDVGQQLRAAFTGQLAQVFHEPYEEIEVRVLLPDRERFSENTLNRLPIVTPEGSVVPLDSVVNIAFQRGFDSLRHTNTKLAIHVYGEVNAQVTNANSILGLLKTEILPNLANTYDIRYDFAGRAEEQRETLADMKYGMMLALIMIYIVLSWVFSSYTWPFVVMVAIPLGLVGAILGHWILGHDLTILSLFGLFGLSGIVINDSIILISTFKTYCEEGIAPKQAIIDASCRRLRAVLLTSLTTIAGLTPLMFESSLQAQFLIPMAISITFGLAFGTLLILVVVPALLMIYEDFLHPLGDVV